MERINGSARTATDADTRAGSRVAWLPCVRRAPVRSFPTRALLVLAPLLTLALGTPVSAQANPSDYDLVLLQRRYEAGVKTCEAAVLSRQTEQPQYDALLARVDAARRSGDDGTWEAAQRLFLQQSEVLAERQRRANDACGGAEDVRRLYLTALDARRRALERELPGAAAQRQQALQAQISDIHARYEELEAAGTGLEGLLVMRPLMEINRTDTPDGVRAKAGFMERRIAQADTLLQAFEEEIERLDSRLQEQRRRENFQAGARRFDDTRPPVASNPPDREGARDENDPGGMTIEERIQELRNHLQQLEFYRNEMAVKLREFRDYLRTIT